jgi:WD40 repeat protein
MLAAYPPRRYVAWYYNYSVISLGRLSIMNELERLRIEVKDLYASLKNEMEQYTIPDGLQQRLNDELANVDLALVAASTDVHLQMARDKVQKAKDILHAAYTGFALYTVLQGHTNRVKHLLFSPDGKTLASMASEHPSDKTARLWDVTSGRERAVLRHPDRVSGIALSPDGKILASGSWDEKVRLWDVSSGREQAVLKPQEYIQGVRSLAFSPDGKILAAGEGGAGGGISKNTVRLWDMTDRRVKAVLKGHLYGVDAIAFSPDGRMLVSGSWDKTVRLWDVIGGRERKVLKGHTDNVTYVAFSPNGKTVVSGSWDKTLRLWKVPGGKELAVMKASRREPAVAFSPNGKLLAYDTGDTVQLRDIASGRERTVHHGSAYAIAFSPNGLTLALGVHEKQHQVWLRDVSEESQETISVLNGPTDLVLSIAYSPDGMTIAAGSADMKIWLWGRATREAEQATGCCEVCGAELGFIEKLTGQKRCKQHR